MIEFHANRIKMRTILADGSLTETKLDAANYIAGKISQLVSGGALVTAGQGHWVRGAERDDLSGELESCVAVIIDVAVPFHLACYLRSLAPRIISEGCYLFGITADWVHVEWTPHSATHFSINALESATQEAS